MMSERLGRVRMPALPAAVVALLFFGTADAGTWTGPSPNCAGCHSADVNAPPRMLSQNATFGKILPLVTSNTTAGFNSTIHYNLDQSCETTFNCGLRNRINTPTDGTANMTSVSGNFTAGQLEAVRSYLLNVRDGAVIAPSPAPTFSPTTINSSSLSNSFSFVIRNYRATRMRFTVTLGGTHASQFETVTSEVTGTGCTATELPAATGTSALSLGECTVTTQLRFRPSSTGPADGSRIANLLVTLTAADSRDPNAVNTPGRTIALSATALPATPSFSINTNALALSSQVGTPVNSNEITITNAASASANLVLGSLASPFSGSHPGDYSLVAAANNPCAISGTTTTLVPGGSCNLVVRFSPGAKGARNATLSIPHNGTNSPQPVALSGTGLQGTLSIGGITTVPLGNVNIGSSSSPQQITVSNAGDAPVTFTGFPRTGTGASEFGVSGCASPLAANASCPLSVTFTPTTTTSRSVTMTINGNASNAPTVTLTGTGLGLPPPVLSPTSIGAFPSTLVATTSGVTRTLTISNPRANALTYARSFSGANGADFAVASETCPTRSIPGGGSCTLTLSFTPAAGPGAGPRAASLDLAFTGFGTDPSPPAQAIALSGTAAVSSPVFNIPSDTITFSAVAGTAGNTTQTTITNSGSAPLVLDTLTIGGTSPGSFNPAAGNTCTPGLSIPATPGSNTCMLAIQFASATAATLDATLTIVHNAAGSPRVISLAGNATAAPTPVLNVGGVTALAFGSVPLGGSAERTLNVSNIGTAPLTLSGLAVSGSAAAEFVRAGSCSGTTALAAGASCTVTLTFAPTAAGARTATLTVDATGASPPSLSVTLTGAGESLPEPVTAPATAVEAFPSTLAGATSTTTRIVTITNPRANSITYTAAVAGGNAADFNVTAESCAPSRVIGANGGACTLSLQFTPVAGGSRSSTLNLTFAGAGADPAPAQANLALAGIAVGPSPVFSLSSNSLSFTAVVGVPSTTNALITNTGNAPLILNSLTFAGAALSDYSLAPTNTCTAGASVAASASCTLAIRFAPVAAGARAASLSIAHDAAGSPAVVSLNGTATPAPQGRIVLSAVALTFPATVVGLTSTQPVTVRNAGDAALTFASFAFGGSASSDYTRAGTCSTAVPLSVGAECTLELTFAPAAAGTRSASLTVQSDASNGSATISLTGPATAAPAPIVTLSTALLAFGPQTVGGIYPPRSLTVTNTGNAATSSLVIEVLGGAFANASTAPCPGSLLPAASCSIDVSFTPTTVNADSTGSVRITSGAAGSPQVVNLTGRGTATVVPVLVWAPLVTPLGFGDVAAGSVSGARSATLLNQGPGGVTLSVLNAVGADRTAFSVTAGTCPLRAPLFEGQSCTIDVRFAPDASGDKTATVQIASTGSAPPELVLQGRGLAGPTPTLTLSPAASLAFNAVRVGSQSEPLEVTLSSTGSGVLRVTDMRVTGAYAMQSRTCPPVPFVLPVGNECIVSVTFAPNAEGAAAGMLAITSDAAAAPREVALSGTGDPKPEVSSGGCSIASGQSVEDPTLWILVMLAAAALYRRRHVSRRSK